MSLEMYAQFIAQEREQYAGNDDNLFAFAFAQAVRYYAFLRIIIGRYETTSQELSSAIESWMAGQPKGHRVLSHEEMAQFEEQGRLSTLVHLEVESFYIFAKILLDKLAMFIERYFGLAQGCSLASHDKLRKNYDRYGRAKGLVFPESFGEKVIFLKEHVCDFRDKQISHLRNLRAIKPSLFGVHRQVRIAVVPFFPNERELDREQVESRELSELIGAIDAYMCCVMDLVLLNRERTVFSLKE